MDASSFRLLQELVEAQLARIRDTLSALADEERGSTYSKFVTQHLDAINQLASDAISSFPVAPEPEKVILGRRLSRLKVLLDEIHGHVFTYRGDVGRRDLPVGLLYLADRLIDRLLKASADPVIHLDGHYMYSTLRLLDQWSRVSTELGITWTDPVEPVILNLPGLDPANALLAPILAHEVGHSVIQRSDLVAEVESRLDNASVSALRDQLQREDSTADVDEALRQFGKWLEELLCDALATELTGPSMLFSAATFLPASAAGMAGPNHPDPSQRIALTLSQLDANNWTASLRRWCPATYEWLVAVSATPPMMNAPRDKFLRDLVDLARDATISVAREYVGESFSSREFDPIESEIEELVSNGVPPAESPSGPISAWVVILACWLHGIRTHGDSAEGIANSVRDRDLSAFALKSIEMSRVLELWRASS